MSSRRRTGSYIPDPLEEQEQEWLFDWINLNIPAHPELENFYHIPNEGKRSRTVGRKLVAQGLKKGVPDNCLPVARAPYHALYIELKRKHDGKVTKEQRDWIERLTLAGNRAVVCYGWEEAAAEIMAYIKGRAGR